jgi:hypothetical protein
MTKVLILLEEAIFPRGRAPHQKWYVVHLDNCSVHISLASIYWHRQAGLENRDWKLGSALPSRHSSSMLKFSGKADTYRPDNSLFNKRNVSKSSRKWMRIISWQLLQTEKLFHFRFCQSHESISSNLIIDFDNFQETWSSRFEYVIQNTRAGSRVKYLLAGQNGKMNFDRDAFQGRSSVISF